jgi:hypothetical protein
MNSIWGKNNCNKTCKRSEKLRTSGKSTYYPIINSFDLLVLLSKTLFGIKFECPEKEDPDQME